MLVLTRKVGEEIVINENIRVTVVAVGRSKVRLGFTTPPEVTVLREEVYARQHDQPTVVAVPSSVAATAVGS
jgi:carbon storage regulator